MSNEEKKTQETGLMQDPAEEERENSSLPAEGMSWDDSETEDEEQE